MTALNVTFAFGAVSGGAGATAGGADAGAIYNLEVPPGSGASVALTNTLIASTAGAAEFCVGEITSSGHNLSDDASCGLAASGDVEGQPGGIGPLADAGGPTRVHPLLSEGAPVDGGDAGACPPADQRGIGRPVDGDGDGAAACDIGAVERGCGEDEPLAVGTPCGSDGNACTDDLCDGAGSCAHTARVDPCARCEVCDPAAGCAATPRTTCATSSAGALTVKESPGTTRRTSSRGRGGRDRRSPSPISRIPSSTDFAFCVFDVSSSPRLLLAAEVATSCGAASCWRSPKGKRWLYASADGAPNGLRKILLGPGRAGESRLAVSGKGAQLLLGTLQSGSLPSTRTQLQAGEVCWETTQ